MSLTITYPFTTATNYTYGSTVEVDSGKAQLVLDGTYPTDNPTIKNATVLNCQGITSFAATITAAGSDAIKFTIEIDGTEYYWDGAAWSTSSGYAQSNTAADINTNISSITYGTGVAIRFVAYLHSDDGSTTPSLDIMTVVYDFWGGAVIAPSTCIVYDNVYDVGGSAITGVTVKANLELTSIYNSQLQLSQKKEETTTNADGYWELELIETASIDPNVKYKFEFSGFDFEDVAYKSVPDESSRRYSELT